MAVKLVVEADTVHGLDPYVEAMRLCEATSACPRCTGQGTDPAYPGRSIRCQESTANTSVAIPAAAARRLGWPISGGNRTTVACDIGKP